MLPRVPRETAIQAPSVTPLPAQAAGLSEPLRRRVGAICVLAAIATFFLTCVASPVADLDMWHEIALIRESISAGHILTNDRFAYTPKLNPAVDHEWGAGVVLYLLAYGPGGWSIPLFKYILAIATAALAVTCARVRGARFGVMIALAPFAILLFALGCATLRAQAYSFLFIAMLLYFLELDQGPPGRRWWIAVWAALFVVWTNVHGGCILGIIVLGLHWIEQVWRRRPHAHLLGAIVLSSAAIAINPFGFAYYRHLWNTLRMPRPNIPEWWPVWEYSRFHTWVFFLTMVIAGYAVLKARRRMSGGTLILAGLAVASILHVRMLPLYAIAWACYIPPAVSDTQLGARIREVFRRPQLITAASLPVLIFSAGILVGSHPLRVAVPDTLYPVGAVRYLESQKFRGNVMTPFDVGAYVTWRLFPGVKVSVDSRYDIAFPSAIVEENFRFFAAGRDWQRTLTKYATDLVLLPRKSAVAKTMPATDWQRIYVDRSFEIYARPGLSLARIERTEKSFSDEFP